MSISAEFYIKVGDVVERNPNVDNELGIVVKTEMYRDHSYLPQEQRVFVLWGTGNVQSINAYLLEVVKSVE